MLLESDQKRLEMESFDQEYSRYSFRVDQNGS
jgi:hypothetical protein